MEKKKNYQSFEPCLACGEEFTDRMYHHIRTRGAGGKDEPHNLISLCQKHHNEVHTMGMVGFSEKYQGISLWLRKSGWKIQIAPIGTMHKWIHPDN